MDGMLTHYYIIFDSYLDIGKFTILRTPWDCIDFRNSMDLPWDTSIATKDKPRYSIVTKCKYYKILVGNYDWVKMFFIDKDTDEYTYEAVTFLLNGSINNSVKNIQAM